MNRYNDGQRDTERIKRNHKRQGALNTAIDDVAAKLGKQYSADVKTKALWLLGEMGKRLPHSVESYLKKLEWFAEHDPHPVVRIHSGGAIRITKKALDKENG